MRGWEGAIHIVDATFSVNIHKLLRIFEMESSLILLIRYDMYVVDKFVRGNVFNAAYRRYI